MSRSVRFKHVHFFVTSAEKKQEQTMSIRVCHTNFVPVVYKHPIWISSMTCWVYAMQMIQRLPYVKSQQMFMDLNRLIGKYEPDICPTCNQVIHMPLLD